MREVIEMSKANMWLIGAHVADVAPEQMCLRPAGAPAWQLGHLCVVRGSLLRMLDVPRDLPEDWPQKFGRGSEPGSDPAHYPEKATLLAALETHNERVLTVVASLPAEALDAPNPVVPFRSRLPTRRMMITLILTTHDGYHTGQLAAWRAAMKLPRIL